VRFQPRLSSLMTVLVFSLLIFSVIPLSTNGSAVIPVFSSDPADALADSQDPNTFTLVVYVKDKAGKLVSGATVQVWKDTWGNGVPFDYIEETENGRSVFTVVREKGSVSPPKVHIEAVKGNLRAEVTVTLTTAATAQTIVIDGPNQPQDKTVELKLRAKDTEGNPIGGAKVNVWHGVLSTAPPDYQEETDVNGVATVKVVAGRTASVFIEVNKGELWGRATPELSGLRMFYPIELKKIDPRILDVDAARLINVKVHVEGEKGVPIEGTRIVLRDRERSSKIDAEGATGPNGEVTIAVLAWNYWIEATKEGYEPGRVGVSLDTSQQGRTIVAPTIKLKRSSSSRAPAEVVVRVLNAADQTAVAAARVVLTGTAGITSGVYRGTTNELGEVRIPLNEYGRFDLEISQDYFETLNGEVRIMVGELQTTLPPYQLKEKPKKEAAGEVVKVKVLAGDKKDRPPIHGASVRVGNLAANTDENGLASIPTTLGLDSTDVFATVTAVGYKSLTQKIPIRRGVKYTDVTAQATVVLQPGDDPATDDTPIRLVVEIIDGLSNQPLSKTNVQIRFKGKVVAIEDSNELGEAHFELKDSERLPLSSLRAGLKLDAYHDNYIHRDSDIAQVLLTPSKESRRITLHLDRDWSALIKAIATLEGKVAAWNNDVRLVRDKSTSIDKLVKQTAEAEARVERLTTELRSSLGLSDAPGNPSNASICQRAEESKRTLLQYESEATSKEQALKQLLDDALTLSGSCQTAVQANTIRSKHSAALKLMADIGTLVNKARPEHERLANFARERSRRFSVPETESKVAQIAQLSAVADQAAITAEVDGRRAIALGHGLSGRHGALTVEIQALKVAHGIDKFPSALPREIKKRLDDIAELVGSRNNEVLMGPDPHGPQQVKAAAERIQVQKTNAETALSSLIAMGQQCQVGPMDDVFERIGNTIVSATVEMSAAASLPGKADDCVKGSSCRSLLADVRPLLERDSLELAETRIAGARAKSCDVSDLESDLDYYKNVRQAANFLVHSTENCRFTAALSFAQQMPESIKGRPLVARAVAAAEAGLRAQERIAQLRNIAKLAVNRSGRGDSANTFIAEAQQFAADIPCLIEEVGRFRDEYKNSTLIDKPVAEDLPTDAERPPATTGIKPKRKPVVEDIPDAADKPMPGGGSQSRRKPLVEDIPDVADKPATRVANRSRQKPVVEDIPDSVARPSRSENRPQVNLPPAAAPPPVAPSAGSWHLKAPQVRQGHRDSLNAVVYTDYQFSATSVRITAVGDPPDRKDWGWSFSGGPPSTLKAGDEFTITISGSLQIQPERNRTGFQAGASVWAEGLTVVTAENAYFDKGQVHPGKFTFRVPPNVTSIKVGFRADISATFVTYIYEKN
jgi:hypothetical protein